MGILLLPPSSLRDNNESNLWSRCLKDTIVFSNNKYEPLEAAEHSALRERQAFVRVKKRADDFKRHSNAQHFSYSILYPVLDFAKQKTYHKHS